MILLLLAVSLAVVVGRPEGGGESEEEIWSQLKSVLPEEYASHAEKSGLSTKRIFQNTVIHRLHTQVLSDTKQLEARQKILHEYVQCACPVCKDEEGEANSSKEKDDNRRGNKQFTLFNLPPIQLPSPLYAITHPQQTLIDLFQSCETKAVLETIKLLRVNLHDVQRRSHEITALVSCNCREASKCRRLLDPLIFSIVTGKNDTELTRAYWQAQLEGFPTIVERGIFDRLTSGIASIMSYVFQSSRSTTPAPTQPPQHAPPPIFSPGADPHEWHQRPEHELCPSVQVNITNTKKGTDVSVGNSTHKEEHDS